MGLGGKRGPGFVSGVWTGWLPVCFCDPALDPTPPQPAAPAVAVQKLPWSCVTPSAAQPRVRPEHLTPPLRLNSDISPSRAPEGARFPSWD